MSFKISVIKKNQILTWGLIFTLGLAGYINSRRDPNNVYADETLSIEDEHLGDAVFVDSKNIIFSSGEKEYIFTSDDFFAENRINRSNEYAKQIEIYEKIVLSENTDNSQKEIATNEIKKINEEKNSLSIAENLIKLVGYKDVVVLKNKENVSVVVLPINEMELDDGKINQIKGIIENEVGVKGDKIQVNSF